MPKIKDVIIDSRKPILIDFQNGKIQPHEVSTLDSALFAEKDSNNKLVGITTIDMVYSGRIDNDPNYNSFLVVQNEGSKHCQLVQVDFCTVAPLFAKSNPVASTTPVKNQMAAELKKQFGSKKAKRFTEQQERLKLNIENVKEHLEKTVADINLSELPVGIHEEGDTLYKPKINREASSREQVYNVSDLVPQDVLDSLEEKVCEILKSDNLKDYELIPTVESYMLTLRASSYPEQTIIDKCKILLYVNYLVKFTITPLKNMKKKFLACDCSAEMDKHIKQHYMVKGSRPLTMRDKALCYAIVLLVLAMDYEIDLEPICKDLRQGIKKMQELSRNLGFSSSTKHKFGIILKIPVPAPILPNRKRKRN